MRCLALTPLLLLAAGCGEAPTGPAPGKVSEIERINQNVGVPPRPQPILYPDIETNKLTDPACAFAPDGGGMAPVVLAMDGKAVMKLDGEIAEFAADKGGQKGASVAWSRYDGRAYSLHFGLGNASGEAANGRRYAAHVELRDGRGRVVYRAAGTAQCP